MAVVFSREENRISPSWVMIAARLVIRQPTMVMALSMYFLTGVS